MHPIGVAAAAFERLPVPDVISAAAIRALCARTDARLRAALPTATQHFAQEMRTYPIAIDTDAANEQHYELPPDFFAHMLGPRRKYSSCLYHAPSTTLAAAEEAALAATCANAALEDGQHILELGCGWGSLTLWMAAHYPNARILSLSNAAPQREYIQSQAQSMGLSNITLVTQDMNDFRTTEQFDRIVSVEMFEHMSNWHALLTRLHPLLHPAGRLFLHVFTHIQTPYRFDHTDKSDWIAQHFFTGGIMPSHALAAAYPELFTVEHEMRWNGDHYRRTALDWLRNFDDAGQEIDTILHAIYGADAFVWKRRWRLFLLATAGLFGFNNGDSWGVSHYRLRPTI